MSKKRILICEDETNIRELIKIGLSDDHYELSEIQDGFSIGTTLFKSNPDLIILDLRMPTTDGFTVLENIQKFYLDKDKKPPKILVVSAFIDDSTIPKIQELPATDWLSKPFHLEELREKVKQILEKE